MRRSTVILGLLLIGIAAAPVQARVFRSFNVPAGRLNTAGLPWESAYKTTMVVNGRRNEVAVYSARRNEAAVEQLKDRLEGQGATVSLNEGRDCTLGVAKWADREARIMVLSPDTQPNQMIFLFYPEPGVKVGKPRFPVAVYPRGVLKDTIANDGTGTACMMLETTDAPGQVQAYYAGALKGDGWVRAVPPSRRGAADSMAVYKKRGKVCCVQVSGNEGKPNRVTVLVQGGGL